MSRFPTPAAWWIAARPKTLWAAVGPVLVGTSMAAVDGSFHLVAAGLALVAAVLIQVGTNFHNDYADFGQGTDQADRKGPLRVTAAGLATPDQMKWATVVVFAAAVVAGTYLMIRGGWPIVIVGFCSILFGVLYTAGRRSLAYLGIADVFVLAFFGPVAVGGTYWVQALQLPFEPLVAGLGPGLLSVAILLVNNIRDAEDDRTAGKRTLVVRTGRTFGLVLYALSIIGAALVPVWLVVTTGSHAATLAASIVVVPGILLLRDMVRAADRAALNPILARTAALGLLWSVLFSAGWII